MLNDSFFDRRLELDMSKQLSITASVVAFLFAFLSIAHACPSLASTNSAIRQTTMNMAASDGSPCGKEKPDICQSVRDRMLSIEPSVSGVDSLEKMVSAAPISFISLNALGSLPAAFVTKVSFHPVFKLPLTFSYLVLRI
jgi:hypothetical protein